MSGPPRCCRLSRFESVSASACESRCRSTVARSSSELITADWFESASEDASDGPSPGESDGTRSLYAGAEGSPGVNRPVQVSVCTARSRVSNIRGRMDLRRSFLALESPAGSSPSSASLGERLSGGCAKDVHFVSLGTTEDAGDRGRRNCSGLMGSCNQIRLQLVSVITLLHSQCRALTPQDGGCRSSVASKEHQRLRCPLPL
jgi:hypothetical protein